MTRDEFIDLLAKASASSVEFARRYVENDLADGCRYHVLLNQSCDKRAIVEEGMYPEDDGIEYASLSSEEAADVVHREGRWPEWIDVSVEAEGAGYTLVRLLCCGRYTDDIQRMYYADRGMGPFGIKSPDLPRGYADGTKFVVPRVQAEG